jgi:hypothetical protein
LCNSPGSCNCFYYNIIPRGVCSLGNHVFCSGAKFSLNRIRTRYLPCHMISAIEIESKRKREQYNYRQSSHCNAKSSTIPMLPKHIY